MRIGISTGGGDCPGTNAVIRAVVQSSLVTHGWSVLGIEDSFAGLICPKRTRELTLDNVRDLLSRGGTILGTTNRDNPLKYPLSTNGGTELCDLSLRCVRNARELGLEGLVIVGGDGTMAIALELFRKGLPVVGVPKTIDNDLAGTEVTFGFDTALHTATDAMDKIHCSAESHHRVMLVELMGRNAGWIALEAGMAAGADVILIPEIPFSIQKVCETVRRRDLAGRNFTIIAIAEGIALPPELRRDGACRQQKSTGEVLREAIEACSGKETRLTVLGHIQRGGTPSPFDRILCTRFGVAAVNLMAAGQFGRMVCLKNGRVDSVPLQEVVNGARIVDQDCELVRTARAIGICFGN